MNNCTNSDLNNSNKKVSKFLWPFEGNHLVIIDKSIVEKLGITENSTVILEQQILHDNTILMRIKKF